MLHFIQAGSLCRVLIDVEGDAQHCLADGKAVGDEFESLVKILELLFGKKLVVLFVMQADDLKEEHHLNLVSVRDGSQLCCARGHVIWSEHLRKELDGVDPVPQTLFCFWLSILSREIGSVGLLHLETSIIVENRVVRQCLQDSGSLMRL